MNEKSTMHKDDPADQIRQRFAAMALVARALGRVDVHGAKQVRSASDIDGDERARRNRKRKIASQSRRQQQQRRRKR